MMVRQRSSSGVAKEIEAQGSSHGEATSSPESSSFSGSDQCYTSLAHPHGTTTNSTADPPIACQYQDGQGSDAYSTKWRVGD